MSDVGAAPRTAVSLSSARAEASRRNGAKSRGPKTPEGKARAAQNALKHGLRAEKCLVLAQEDAAAFNALAAALVEELAPVGALQRILVGRIAAAAWRLERAERLEVEVFALRGFGGASPGLTLIRDGNGTRSIETLMRYRAAALAELTRALRTLQALQAEQRAAKPPRPATAEAPVRPRLVAPPPATVPVDRPAARGETPNEPKGQGKACASGRPSDRANPRAPFRTAHAGRASIDGVRPVPPPTPAPEPRHTVDRANPTR